MKKIALSIVFFVVCIFANAQSSKASIRFDESTFDFGTVKEEVGSVTHVFEFTNTGNVDVVLTNVRASCGCTTPKWQKEPIAPGARGSITVKYSTTNRPGPFTKSITVMSNADKKTLIIKGTVTKKGEKIEVTYPKLKGKLRLKNDVVSFGDVYNGKTKTINMSVANATTEPIVVTFVNLPKFITIKPINLNGNECANANITFDASKIKDWGMIHSQIKFTTNPDQKSEIQTLNVDANIVEEFTQEQRDNAPILEAENEINIGTIILGKKKSATFNLKNTGKNTLLIHKTIEPNNIKFKAPKSIAAGKTGTAKITIDASKMDIRHYSETIKLIENDPYRPQKNIKIIFDVVKE